MDPGNIEPDVAQAIHWIESNIDPSGWDDSVGDDCVCDRATGNNHCADCLTIVQ